MTAMRFVDTNILLYAVSAAADDQPKSRVALLTLEDDDLALSVQVLQEFYVQTGWLMSRRSCESSLSSVSRCKR